MVTGIGLVSGGLDSVLAVKVLQEQGIKIIGIAFVTPFFGAEKAKRAAELYDFELRAVDITQVYMPMLMSPRYGYGKGMNPCIDCHALMFREAGKIMEAEGADFLFSGEVLGERPMSQNRQSLINVAKESGYADYILRPLSAKLLQETLPERAGKIDREKLLSISGRSRKPQMELVSYYGLIEYEQPAGGCLLTKDGYVRRLRDLSERGNVFNIRDVNLLRIGRHFRLNTGEKVIVGRDQVENERILEMKNTTDIILDIQDYPGPITIVPHGTPSREALEKAASISVRYCDAPKDEKVAVICQDKEKTYTLLVEAAADTELNRIRL